GDDPQAMGAGLDAGHGPAPAGLLAEHRQHDRHGGKEAGRTRRYVRKEIAWTTRRRSTADWAMSRNAAPARVPATPRRSIARMSSAVPTGAPPAIRAAAAPSGMPSRCATT